MFAREIWTDTREFAMKQTPGDSKMAFAGFKLIGWNPDEPGLDQEIKGGARPLMGVSICERKFCKAGFGTVALSLGGGASGRKVMRAVEKF